MHACMHACVCVCVCVCAGAMVRRFYLAINSETSTLKADKSVFTIADGIVQVLLCIHMRTHVFARA